MTALLDRPLFPTQTGAPVRRCVICTRPTDAVRGYVCDKHLGQLAALLHEAEEEAVDLVVGPSLAIRYDTSGGGGLASQQAPVRLDALVLTDPRHGTGTTRAEFDETGWDDTPSVFETLHAWARLVREERHLLPPTKPVVERRPGAVAGPFCHSCLHPSCAALRVTRDTPIPLTVATERALLSRHLDWIVEQPWVDEMHDELDQLVTRLKRTNASYEMPAGTCSTLQADGRLCDGSVWHVLLQPDGKVAPATRKPGKDDEPGFRCATCKRVWTGTEAVRLRDRMWRDEQQNRQTQHGGSAA